MNFLFQDANAQQATPEVPKADVAPVTTTSVGAVAPAAAPQEPSALAGVAPFLLIAVVFYFFMIRPQQKKYKEHQDMVSSITRGDRVITTGGLIGKVSKVEDDVIFVEIADAVTVQIARQSVTSVTSKHGETKKGTEAPAAEAKKSASAAKTGKPAKKKVANDN